MNNSVNQRHISRLGNLCLIFIFGNCQLSTEETEEKKSAFEKLNTEY